MKLDDLNRLIYNPEWTGKLLHYFLSGASQSKSEKIKFELLYFAHPFLYDDVILKRLNASNSRTSLSAFLSDKLVRIRLVGIGAKVESFREVTNRSIVATGKYLEVLEGGFVRTSKQITYSNATIIPETRVYFKAAQNLGLILAKENHLEAILKIGS